MRDPTRFRVVCRCPRSSQLGLLLRLPRISGLIDPRLRRSDPEELVGAQVEEPESDRFDCIFIPESLPGFPRFGGS
jgi:hypothetical protein